MAWNERYVRADAAGSGDGTTDTNSGANGAFTLAEAITHSTTNTGVLYNVRAGTYANTTTSRTFSGTGTTTAPNWWRGFNTTPGDRDTDPTLTPPLLTFTTGLCAFSGSHQIFSHLDVIGANAGRQLSIGGSNLKIDRCRAENTNAAAGSSAMSNATSGTNVFTRCWFKATSSATRSVQNTQMADYLGCVFTGGGAGLDSSATVRLIGCVFRATGSHGFQQLSVGSSAEIIGCTFRGTGGDGARFDVLAAAGNVIANCQFVSCGGYGINNNTGANTNLVHRLANAFYSNTSGNENGFGDSPSVAEIIESTDPHTSSTDLTLVTGSLSLGAVQPGRFENESYTSYGDIGAVQKQASGSTYVFQLEG